MSHQSLWSKAYSRLFTKKFELASIKDAIRTIIRISYSGRPNSDDHRSHRSAVLFQNVFSGNLNASNGLELPNWKS